MQRNLFYIVSKRSIIFFINKLFKRTEIIDNLLSILNIKIKFNNLKNSKTFLEDNDLYKDLFSQFENKKISLIEFGTYEGKSLKKFLSYNSHENSIFYGFDSFKGLPEYWIKGFPKGTFNLDGKVPKIKDKRANLIKGYFQNTLPKFLAKTNIKRNLIVHFDADIYSSTLFCLLQLDNLKISYFAIFDEFFPSEANALKTYIDITNAKVEIIAKTQNINAKVPRIVSCKIIPSKTFCC